MRYLTHSIIVGLMGALMSCSGEQGEQGPPGAAGPSGNNGDPGAAGAPALTKVSDAPADKCPDGGKMIEVGNDKNGNGTLDADEINASSTSYICNGGSGKPSLVRTSIEPAGANCAYGGVKIETGLDANGDGKLDDSEVSASATTYACNVSPGGSVSPSEGLVIAVKKDGVSTATTGPITVRFTLKDSRGYPVDINGKYSKNTVIQPRFALAYFTKDATTGAVSPLKVYTKSGTTPMPTAYAAGSAGQGTITENGTGAGDYTYTFPTADTTGGAVKVQYDATKLGETHVLWIQAARQTDETYTANANTFYAANQDYYFIPSGTGTPAKREIVTAANCNKCHDSFRPETTTSAAFHGGGRLDPKFCNVCHNPDRTSNPKADSAAFVHNIHNGAKIATADRFHGIAASYPQDIRNCNACHKGAENEAQSKTTISRLVCTSCHDNVDFVNESSTTLPKCNTLTAKYDADGVQVKCAHSLGTMSDDLSCASSCHGAGKPYDIAKFHKPVAKPDPAATYLGGSNTNTNAAYLAATGYVPTGASQITYDVKTVDTVTDTAGKHPRVVFKLKKDGTDVVFATYAAGSVTEMIPNFIGGPSVYFAWSVEQDGIEAPVDFNQSASAPVRGLWNGKSTGTLTGPDSSGYYTAVLTGTNLPTTAKMLTGGLGYTYSLGSTYGDTSTVPLTQTNVAGYAFDNTDPTKPKGGLIVPVPNVWKTATAFTARRAIVDNAKCNNCHGMLGAAPTFHAGQRNDGPTCSFCHTPNRTSSGWAAGSKYFIHAIHAGRKRVTPYVWHATAPGAGYGEVEFPSALNKCTNCHAPNTYDFTATASSNSLPNQLFMTVATGTYSSTSPSYYTFSPYVTTGTAYGSGPAYDSTTGKMTAGADTNLVISPIMTACSSCHDSPTALDHMKGNGGHFYEPRALAQSSTAPKEQCMMCHGPGRVAAIGEVHQK